MSKYSGLGGLLKRGAIVPAEILRPILKERVRHPNPAMKPPAGDEPVVGNSHLTPDGKLKWAPSGPVPEFTRPRPVLVEADVRMVKRVAVRADVDRR